MTQDISAGRRILVLEDDETLRLVISRALTRAGFDVRATASPSSAIERMARRDADLLVADVLLGDENFLDRLEELQHVRPDAPVLVISAQTTAATAIQAVRGGAYEYLPKPFDLDDLVDAVCRALDTGERAGQQRSGANPFPDLVGRSPAMQTAFRLLARLSTASAPVLFTGPDGSGRASAARTLHRACKPGKALVEAGPDRLRREGVQIFREAKGAGLLLRRAERWDDAIQDMVLEQLDQLADTRLYVTALADVRTVMAPALFERLAVGHVDLPPLRARGDDRLRLFEHFLKKHGRTDLAIARDAAEFINAYPWPGEVAELERTAARLAVQGDRGTLGLPALQEALTAPTAPGTGSTLEDAVRAFVAARLSEHSQDIAGDTAAIVDRAMIETVLAHCGGVRRDAARYLGLNRNTLARRLTALGMDSGGEE
jgi:two-component system nitrogen regulation response regulator GlnG